FRFLLYPGSLYWTEEGYRFSWRVMLMEKSGTSFFYVKDPVTGRRGEVNNAKFLTPLQERMMATQPDMILQYAHYLHTVYTNKGVKDPIITVEDYVTLNGSGSRLYIDSTIDLARQQETFRPTTWILPFHPNTPSK
ncbi:MAG: HTTM domain-containing protein, partial [Bacteroidota bacterium]